MTILEDLKNIVDRVKKYFSDQKIDQIPFNTEDYRLDEITKSWVPKEVNVDDLHGIRIALQELAKVVDVDNRGITAKGSLADGATVARTILYEDLLFNTVRIIADCTSNIDLDVEIFYKNVLENDWISFYSESLVPGDTKLNYRINISEYQDLKIQLTNNSGATLNYNLILFFSKTKFRDIKVVTPTDDLQVALDQGGAIYLTTGNHIINTAIALDQSKSVFLYGAGDDSLITLVGDISAFIITSAISVVFKDFKIDATSLTTSTKRIIDNSEADDHRTFIDNITITGDGTNGYGIYNLADLAIVVNCYIESVNIGIYNVSNYSFLKNNIILNTAGDGIYNYGAVYIVILGNAVANPGGNGIYNQTNQCIIKGNFCNSVGEHGIITVTDYTSIIGNFCINGSNNSDDNFGGVCISTNADKCIVSGNTIVDNRNSGSGTFYGILIDHSDCSDNIIGSNILSGNDDVISDSGTNTKILGDDTAYNATTWNDNLGTPTKNAIRDKIEAILAWIISDVAYNATSWNGVTAIAPSKNVMRDWIEAHLVADIHHDEDHTHLEEDITDLDHILDHNDLDNINIGTDYEHLSQAQVDALHAIVVAGDLSHNSLANLNAGTAYEHITQTQKDALHAVVTDFYTQAEINALINNYNINVDLFGWAGFAQTNNQWYVAHSDPDAKISGSIICPETRSDWKIGIVHMSTISSRTDSGIMYLSNAGHGESWSWNISNGGNMDIVNTTLNCTYLTDMATGLSITKGDFVFIRWYKDNNAGTNDLYIIGFVLYH